MWFSKHDFSEDVDGSQQVSWIFSLFSLLGLAVTALWSGSSGTNWKQALALNAIMMMIAGVSAMLGGLLGFLFGIPKTLQDSGDERTDAGQGRQLVNTNLERVSDWLTTLLIGATLTQITVLPGLIWEFAEKIVANTGIAAPGFTSVISGTFVYFLIVGFFSGYLLTRLFLTLAFRAVQDHLNKRAKDIVLGRNAGDPKPNAEQLAAAREIVKKPLGTLTAVSDVKAWAQAQVILGSLSHAADAYKTLLSLAPNDPQVKLDYASVLDKLGNTDAADQMRAAAAELIERINHEQNAKLENSRMLAMLYRPGEHRNVIAIGEDKLKSNYNDAETHFLLSVAYAQEYRELIEKEGVAPDDDRAAKTRDQVVRHLERAIALNPANRERARMLWDPNYPKVASEDDFEIFKREGNREFEELLRKG